MPDLHADHDRPRCDALRQRIRAYVHTTDRQQWRVVADDRMWTWTAFDTKGTFAKAIDDAIRAGSMIPIVRGVGRVAKFYPEHVVAISTYVKEESSE